MAKRIRIAGADITLTGMDPKEKRELVLATRSAVRYNRSGWAEAKRQIRVARRLVLRDAAPSHDGLERLEVASLTDSGPMFL
jgi:hypothetical protein